MSSFRQDVNEWFRKEEEAEAARMKELSKEEARKDTEQKEGEQAAAALFAAFKEAVETEIREVGRGFEVSHPSITGADVEILVNTRWLLTAKLEGKKVTTDVYLGAAWENPRMREESGTYGTSVYTIALDNEGNWFWRRDMVASNNAENRKHLPVTTFLTTSARAASVPHNSEFIELFLNQALWLLKNGQARPSNGTFIV